MKSIRIYLLLALLAIITLVTFVSLLHGYQSSLAKAEQLFDQRLETMAGIIANANQDTHPRHVGEFELPDNVLFQIWSSNKALLVHSHNAPLLPLVEMNQLKEYHDVNFDGYRWRAFTLWDNNLKRWIVIAERADIRYALAENVVLTSVTPIVLALPFAGLIIWFAIGFGLKPLRDLSSQLNAKQVDDLSPVVLIQTPNELSQLVNTTNALLRRLQDAFTREQRFSADAAHELRTPISVLKVQVHNLKKHPDISDSQLAPLVSGIDRMGHVIEQILALYRYSAENVAVTNKTVDLVSIAQHVIASNYDIFADKNQKISLNGAEHAKVNGITFALETLIQNLISNASKYTPKESEIELSILEHSAGIDLLCEDSGQGISEQDYERVFERFYRVNGDQHSSGTLGCGLGLAIVHHITDLHNAQITLDRSSRLGGLKVLISFPKMSNIL